MIKYFAAKVLLYYPTAMYLIKTPRFIQALWPAYVWRVPTRERVLHLTFDDGPIPEITPWVVEMLAQYDARATFFCVGENVYRYPEIFQQLLDAGHSVGNHTYNHLNSWKTPDREYVKNVSQAANFVKSPLFRPPYGKLNRRHRMFLGQQYSIVMWDVLSGDFDLQISGEQCWENVRDNARPGSIIVFHDSLKAEPRLRYALPKVLEYYAALGYRFEALPMALPNQRSNEKPSETNSSYRLLSNR